MDIPESINSTDVHLGSFTSTILCKAVVRTHFQVFYVYIFISLGTMPLSGIPGHMVNTALRGTIKLFLWLLYICV